MTAQRHYAILANLASDASQVWHNPSGVSMAASAVIPACRCPRWMRRCAPRSTLASPSAPVRPVGVRRSASGRVGGHRHLVDRAGGRTEPGLADDALVAATAETTGLPERKVRTAVRYYTWYREDIDERIAANRAAAREAEQDPLRGMIAPRDCSTRSPPPCTTPSRAAASPVPTTSAGSPEFSV